MTVGVAEVVRPSRMSCSVSGSAVWGEEKAVVLFKGELLLHRPLDHRAVGELGEKVLITGGRRDRFFPDLGPVLFHNELHTLGGVHCAQGEQHIGPHVHVTVDVRIKVRCWRLKDVERILKCLALSKPGTSLQARYIQS